MWIICNKTGKKSTFPWLQGLNCAIGGTMSNDLDLPTTVQKYYRTHRMRGTLDKDNDPLPTEIIYDGGHKVKRLGSLNLFAVFNGDGKQLGIVHSLDEGELMLIDSDCDTCQKKRIYPHGYYTEWVDDDQQLQ